MCASPLRLRKHGDGIAPARWFNRNLDRATNGCGVALARLERRPFRMLVVLAVIGFGAAALDERLQGSFLPDEDKVVMMVLSETPDGSTTAQTQALVEKVEDYLRVQGSNTVESTFSVLGFSFGGSGQNQAMLFARLRDYEDRPDRDVASLVTRANGYFFMNNRAGQAFPATPCDRGHGRVLGLLKVSRGPVGPRERGVTTAADELAATGQEDGRVTNLLGNEALFENSLQLDIDQQKAAAFGLSISEENAMLSVIFWGRDVNDFALGTELRPVIVQCEADARSQPEDIDRWGARQRWRHDQFWRLHHPRLGSGTAGACPLWRHPRHGTVGRCVPRPVSGAAMEKMVADMPGGDGTAWTHQS